MDRNTCENFRVDFANTVKELEKKYGCSIRIGNISFDNHSFTTKMSVNENVNVPGFVPKGFEQEYTDLLAVHPDYNFAKVATFEGDTWRLVGLRKRARRAPYVVVNSEGDVRALNALASLKYFGI